MSILYPMPPKFTSIRKALESPVEFIPREECSDQVCDLERSLGWQCRKLNWKIKCGGRELIRKWSLRSG